MTFVLVLVTELVVKPHMSVKGNLLTLHSTKQKGVKL